MRLWVDVEDIFNYALHVKRPSGIQRVAFELERALAERAPDSVQFIRHGKQPGSFVTVPFARLEALFNELSARHRHDEEAAPPAVAAVAAPQMPVAPPVAPPMTLYRRVRRRVLRLLPRALQEPAKIVWVRVRETVFAVRDFVKAALSAETWRRQERALPSAPEAAPEADKQPLAEKDKSLPMAQGDWLVVLGSPWSSDRYAARVAQFCAQHGLRFALLIYDIIPLRRPEWVDYGLRLSFYEWFHTVAPQADLLLAISRATAEDVERYARQMSLPLRGRVRPVPLGTGFGQPATPARTRRLPPRRSFALVVSTIEARKNHLLLFRLWRELTEIMPMEKIPRLVFAGRVGWLVQDLMQQLQNTDWLNGKIMLIDSPSDAELAALYEDCLFTLYPSFYEGWGLPVSESLAYGAPCISSNRTSLPEAGGDLARYFNPDDLAEAVRVVREVIEDPAGLQAWRERVAREFRTVSWTDSAGAIITELNKAQREQMQPVFAAAQ